MAANFSPSQQQFFNAFVKTSGLNPGVVKAWMAAEEPIGAHTGYKGTQDWLNVGITDSGPMGAGNAVWQNPVQAGIRSAQWLRGQWADPGFGHAAPGVQAIAHTAGMSPQAQITAIQHSGWASSGYPDLPGLYQQYSGTTVTPGGLPTMPATTGGTNALKQMSNRTVAKTTTGFDQGSYNAAVANSIAGQYLNAPTKDPYSIGTPKTGLSTVPGANPLLTAGVLSTQTPNPADYQTTQTKLEKIAGSPTGPAQLNQHPVAFQQNLKGSRYTNPLPGANWERTDMGVDASMQNGAAIRALGDSQVVSINPNWYKGQPYVLFKLLNGPQAGKYYYIAEAINPRVRPGQTVRAGQVVGTYNSGGTGLELGWGTAGSSTLAQSTTGYSEGEQTQAGKSFRNFLNGIGAHAG